MDYTPITPSFGGVMAEQGCNGRECNRECNARKREMREKTVLIAELYKVVALVRTFNGERSPARGRCAVRTTQYTHDPTVTTRRRGGARITRCCRHRPGGGGRRGGYARERRRWPYGRCGRARAAAGRGQGECPGRGGGASQRAAASGRAGRTGRCRRGRPARLEDRRHVPARGGGTTGKKVVELGGRMLCRCGSRCLRARRAGRAWPGRRARVSREAAIWVQHGSGAQIM